MNKSLFKTTSIILPTLLFLLLNNPTSALTYQTTTDVEFTVNPSINVSLSSNDLLISDLTPGTSSDSNIITVNVSTNAGYGYYLAATAGTSSGSTNLVNTVDNSRVFTNLSSNKASLSNFSDNTWGYSYSTDNGTSWISGNNDAATAGYNGLPLDNNDNGATGIKLASTDSYVSTNSIKFKIGAKASTTQSGGTYTNTVNFYAVANPEPTLGPVACYPGKICYNINALSGAEGTMGRQNASDGNTVSLIASNYSREGYGFAGWSDTYDYTGNIYGPQEEITIPNGTTANGLSLYAIWVPSVGSLQDYSKVQQVCQELIPASSQYSDGHDYKSLGSVSALTDQRDGQTYAIAKLVDDRCWMIENLRLDNTAELTMDNTNNPLNDGTNVTLKHNFADLQTYNTLSATTSVMYDEATAPDGWCGTGSATCVDQSRIRTDNTANRAIYNPNDAVSNNANIYSYGNYYNWYSATAGTGIYSKNSGVTEGSICPYGWDLPVGGTSSSDFGSLNNILSGNPNSVAPVDIGENSEPVSATAMKQLLRRFPNNFVYAGQVYPTFDSRGSNARYWSSTASTYSDAYSFIMVSNGVRPGTYSSLKHHGMTIRCIAEEAH